MTAPSLLGELEGIVRLAEKATPGPFVVDGYGDVTANGEDVARIASDGYSAYHDAHLFADAANFIRAHHAEIADMAKRLEAAERGAATERAIQNAADKLPDGYAISLYVENGSGYIDLTDPEGDPVPVDTDDRSMADQITQATKVAIDAATQEGEG